MSLRSLPAVAEEVRRSIRRRLLFANIAGGLAVITFVQLASGERLAPELPVPLILAAPFVPAALLLLPAYVWGHRAFSRAIAWAVEQRAPTPAERYAILREPWRQALRPLVFWIIAAGLYASLSALAGADGQTVLRVVDGTLIGGVTTCAIGYLIIERSFRPLFAHVLGGRPEARLPTPGVRLRLMLAWAVGSGVPLLAIAAVSLLDGTEIPTYALSVLALIGLAAGLLATVSSAGTIAEPLDGLRAALGQVRDGNLDVGLAVDDGGEVGEVQAGFNDMVDGLRERRALQDLFGRHVGREVARRALERGTGLSGEQAEASAVFVDLIGSTAMTEVLPPGEVVDTLNDYFDVVVDTVDAHGGWVNKFEGDGALCIFGVPGTQPDHPDRALRAARQLSTRLDLLAERHPGLEAGIGVSSGRVVAGNVGTEARYEYTVIGPAVNEASRLTDIAKGRAVRVLASAESVRRAGAEASHWHDVGTVALRGRATPTAIYEPLVEHAAPAEARQ